MMQPDRETRPQLSYSESLNKTLRFSQEEAKYRNHNYIGPEHLLLGLIREPTARTVLNQFEETPRHIDIFPGITIIETVDTQVNYIIGRSERRLPGKISLNPQAEKVLKLAMDEANRSRAKEINSIHALIGIILQGENIASAILQNLGIAKEQITTLRAKAKEADSQKSDFGTYWKDFSASDLGIRIHIESILTKLKMLPEKPEPEKPKSTPSV